MDLAGYRLPEIMTNPKGRRAVTAMPTVPWSTSFNDKPSGKGKVLPEPEFRQNDESGSNFNAKNMALNVTVIPAVDAMPAFSPAPSA
jgi:hypothetical protein